MTTYFNVMQLRSQFHNREDNTPTGEMFESIKSLIVPNEKPLGPSEETNKFPGCGSPWRKP